MSQLTSPVSDSLTALGGCGSGTGCTAVHDLNSAPLSPELQILAFSRYYSAGPAPF